MTKNDRMKREAAKFFGKSENDITEGEQTFYESCRFMSLYSSGPAKLGEVYPFGRAGGKGKTTLL